MGVSSVLSAILGGRRNTDETPAQRKRKRDRALAGLPMKWAEYHISQNSFPGDVNSFETEVPWKGPFAGPAALRKHDRFEEIMEKQRRAANRRTVDEQGHFSLVRCRFNY